MRAPGFWSARRPTALAWLLAPLGAVYGLATATRLLMRRPFDVGVPVVCVGNLTAGGTGKTPVVLDLVRRLAPRGLPVQVLSRGYGGRGMVLTRVDPARHTAQRVGDEPLLLAAAAPTWVGRDRTMAAWAAIESGARLLVLDDGFQDPSLKKALSLVVVDGAVGFGNGCLIPAGPLRESVAAGLRRADAVVVVGADEAGVAATVAAKARGDLPVLACRMRPGPELATLKEGPVYAFAGIGRPEKFFRTLEEGGCDVVGTRSFPDHHRFTDAEISAVLAEAARLKARPVTTEKDLQRLPPDRRQGIEVLTITLEWEDEAALEGLLAPLFR